MCVIIHLAPNASMKKEHLYNAVYNNWQGFGLVLKDGNGQLQIIKEYDEAGNDPEKIWNYLENNKEIERFLHVRYTTRGASNYDNTQPFEVYSSNSRRVIFMHNGTLTGFGDFNNSNGKSDTFDFCQKILIPSLLRWSGENGKADYTDPEFRKLILEKQWTHASKGLFISNDLDSLKIGPSHSGWSKYEDGEGDIWVSNTEYFNNLQRGPELERRKEEQKRKEEEERKARSMFQDNSSNNQTSNNSQIVPFEGDALNKDPNILKAFNTIVNTWDFNDPADIAKLSNLTYDEWADVINEGGIWVSAALIECIAKAFGKVHIQLVSEKKKHERARIKIENIAKIDKSLVERASNVG